MRFAPFSLFPLLVIGMLFAAPVQAQSCTNNTLHSSQMLADDLAGPEALPTSPLAAPASALTQAVAALQTQLAALQADNERMYHLLLQQQAELAIQRGTTRASLQALHTRLNNFRLPETPPHAPPPPSLSQAAAW